MGQLRFAIDTAGSRSAADGEQRRLRNVPARRLLTELDYRSVPGSFRNDLDHSCLASPFTGPVWDHFSRGCPVSLVL